MHISCICIASAVLMGSFSSNSASMEPMSPPEVDATELEIAKYLTFLRRTPDALASTEDQETILREYVFAAASRFIHNGRSPIPEYAIEALLPHDERVALHIAELRLLSLWPMTEYELEPITWVHLHYCLQLIGTYPSESSLRTVFVLLHRYRIPKLSVQLYEVALTVIDGIEGGSYYSHVVDQYEPVPDDAVEVESDSIELDENAMEQLRIEIERRIPR